MFKKSITIVLIVSLFVSFVSRAQGVGCFQRFCASVAGVTAVCSSYFAKPVRCYSRHETSVKDRKFPKDAELRQYPAFAKFATRYSFSSELEAAVNQHFLKGPQIDRIINVERLKRVIEQEKLDLLQVPHKCLYRMGDGEYAVLSKRMDLKHLDRTTKLSLAEVQQLAKLAEKSAYIDFHLKNVSRTGDGKIGLCDTEDRSFHTLPSHLIIEAEALINLSCCHYIDLGAKQWIEQREAYLDCLISGADPSKILKLKPLNANSAYDPDGMDFETVKRELADYRDKH